MKAFWWFRENAVAGMARPGFNSCRWFDLPFDEAVVMGWLGQHSAGPVSLEGFRVHLESYLPRVRSFYQISEVDIQRLMGEFADPKVLNSIVGRLAERSKFLVNASVQDDYLHFELNRTQLNQEIEFLKSQKISHIVSLTEEHRIANELKDHFELTHISITDMLAPTFEQAQALAEILENAEKSGERMAIHCLAGIGRTSTMLMAAEILRGKQSLEELLSHLQKQNPYFSFKGPQAEFIRSLIQKPNPVHVVAAIIRDDSKFLLGRRSLYKKAAPGIWSPVSGRVEAGESQASAIQRECYEEVGLTVRARNKVAEFNIDGETTRFHWWLVDKVSAQPVLKNDEHSELRWFTVDEMKKEPGFPSNYIQVYEKLLSYEC